MSRKRQSESYGKDGMDLPPYQRSPLGRRVAGSNCIPGGSTGTPKPNNRTANGRNRAGLHRGVNGLHWLIYAEALRATKMGDWLVTLMEAVEIPHIR